MPQFLSNIDLSKKIREVASGENLRMAVAFIGKDTAEVLNLDILSKDVKIICDIGMGGTNPNELEKLFSKKNVKLKYLENFHAKIYLSDIGAVVGSANLSINGIGKIKSKPHLMEAGVFLDAEDDSEEVRKIEKWFKTQFDDANDINEEKIGEVRKMWNERSSVRNILSAKEGEIVDDFLTLLLEHESLFSDTSFVCSEGDNDTGVEVRAREEFGGRKLKSKYDKYHLYSEWFLEDDLPEIFINIHKEEDETFLITKYEEGDVQDPQDGLKNFFAREMDWDEGKIAGSNVRIKERTFTDPDGLLNMRLNEEHTNNDEVETFNALLKGPELIEKIRESQKNSVIKGKPYGGA